METNTHVPHLVSNLENKVSKLESEEATVIAKAIYEGYQDPHDDEDIRKVIFNKSHGKVFRRFIIDFGLVDPDILDRSQVREFEVDETYCREQLAPLLKKDGRILNPIMTTQSTPGRELIEHGHNRAYSSKLAWSELIRLLPRFRLDKTLYEKTAEGWVPAPSGQAAFYQRVMKTQTNGPPKNNPYSMADVKVHLKELYDIDPTFDGLLGKQDGYPSREEFDRVMDFLHPDQFLLKGTRTKIYNLWICGAASSKILPIGLDEVTASLANLGWATGMTMTTQGNPAREKFLSHQDQPSGAYIGVVSDHASDFERNMVLAIVNQWASGNITAGTKVWLHLKIHKAASTLVTLSTQRKSFLTRVEQWQGFFAFYHIDVEFEKVFFVPQLRDITDKGSTHKWHAATGKFVKSP